MQPQTPPHSSRAIIILLFDPLITDGLTNGPTDKASYRVASPRLKIQIQQGWIHSNPVADGLAGVVQKPPRIQKCDGPTNLPTYQHFWLASVIFGHFWSFLIIFDHFWSFLVIFDHVSLLGKVCWFRSAGLSLLV